MKSDKINIAIDMIICMAIKDLAEAEGISEDEARNRLMSSRAVEMLYDAGNDLWSEGPDSLIRLYRDERAFGNKENN